MAEKRKKRRIVVWYDPRAEFRPWLGELCGTWPEQCCLQESDFGILRGHICVVQGSFFEGRFAVEAAVATEAPGPLLVYVPAARPEPTESPPAELEKAGETYEPQLKRLARNVLRHQYSDGQIDEWLAGDTLSYADVCGLLAEDEGRQKSLLQVIYSGARDNAALLADWLAMPELDAVVAAQIPCWLAWR